MVLITENITNPTSAKLVTAIENALNTNANWSFIKEVTATTYTFRVWRCDGSETYPFYLILISNSANLTTLYATVSEQFDIVTNKAIGLALTGAITSYDTGGARASTDLTATGCLQLSGIPSTGTHTAKIWVEDNCLLVGTSGALKYLYFGMFDSYWSEFTENEYPICAFQISNGSGANDVIYSRIPGGVSGSLSPAGTIERFMNIGVPGTGVTYLNGLSVLGRLRLNSLESTAPRGLALSSFKTTLKPTGSNYGDTVTDGDDVYTLVTGSTSDGAFSYLMRN